MESLAYEKAAVAHNAAAHLCALAIAEPRTESESTRRAVAHFQHAAGIFGFIESTTQLAGAPDEYLPPGLHAQRELMLAQAQECVWHKAVRDVLKDSTVARLAVACAERYALVQRAGRALPDTWLAHARIKELHFAAAAQLRRSRDDLAERRYGDELGRLTLALEHTSAAQRVRSRGLPAPGVLDDLHALQGTIQANLSRAERDNELVYLEMPTPRTSLSEIGAAHMVKAVVREGLDAPVTWLRGRARVWFDRLLTYGIDAALRVYSDRRAHYIDDVLGRRATALDEAAHSCVRADQRTLGPASPPAARVHRATIAPAAVSAQAGRRGSSGWHRRTPPACARYARVSA